MTCISNDYRYDSLFARPVEALAQRNDVVIGLTTSGRSANVLRGLAAAQKAGAVNIALTGAAGLVDATADHVVAVPSTVTAHIQEIHLMVIHVWCASVDEIGTLPSRA